MAKTLEYFGLETKLKWPNDVHIDQRKICGILSETEDDFMIIGVGVNLNNKEFPEHISGTSYVSETGKEIDILKFLEKFVEIFYTVVKEDFLDEYRKYSSTIGSEVTVKNGGEITGTAVDVDEQGRLILLLENGKKNENIFRRSITAAPVPVECRPCSWDGRRQSSLLLPAWESHL